MANQLKKDPTRTITLRKTLMREMKRRFNGLSKSIKELIVDKDVFGLVEAKPLKILVSSQEWRFLSDARKVEEYQKWLQAEIDAGILETTTYPPWISSYTGKAYNKGFKRAYTTVNRPKPGQSADSLQSGLSGFVQGSFGAGELSSKLELLYSRAFTNLNGITSAMGTQLSRILTDGLIRGARPISIANEMVRTVGNITRTRAYTLARTEIIYAHAEGQLDSFMAMGINEVSAKAEWSTAGDALVCPQCEPMEGVVLTIKEARGAIPLHPNCRCMWIPADVGESKTGQLWGRKGVRAIKKSVKAQGGLSKSTWPLKRKA